MSSFFSIKQFRDLFFNTLENIYPNQELASIFNILLENRLKLSKTDIILKKDQIFEVNQLLKDLNRLNEHEPIQYIIEESSFYGLNFYVNSDVLIPRPETEEIVHKIILEHNKEKAIKIWDIGTGSGIIGITLAHHFKNGEILCSDFSVKAIEVAKLNGLKNGVKINCIHHNILLDSTDLIPTDFDIIVSNPPYIPESYKKNMHKNVINYEPETALFVPDNNPLLFYDKIAQIAFKHLKNGGELIFETHELFHKKMSMNLEILGFSEITCYDDLNKKPRFVKAKKSVSLHV